MKGLPAGSLTRRLWNILVFRIPIPAKFTLFSVSVAVFVFGLGGVGAWFASDERARWAIAGATVLFLLPLTGFGVLLTRSLAKPLALMQRQVVALTEGNQQLTERMELERVDEVGELSFRLNTLLDTLHELNTFKKVIESDESEADVYARLGVEFKRFGLPKFQVYQVDPAKNRLNVAFRSEPTTDEWCTKDIHVSPDMCRAKRTGDLTCSASFPDICKYFACPGKQHLCVPMIIGGSAGGVAQFIFEDQPAPTHGAMLARTARAREYLRESLPVLEAKRLTSSLRESALKDAMTGLYNRRFLDEYVENLVAITQRRNSSLALLMCDLDFFKQINDTHGHDAGDAVLRETAQVMRRSLRGSDILIRYGGEEFLSVLQDCRDGQAREVAERIRKGMEEAKIRIPAGTVTRTISIGIADFPKQSTSFWQAVKFADTALYKAKETGRNKVVEFTPDMWTQNQY